MSFHDDNPYKPPQVADAIVDAAVAEHYGLWRKGNTLVMHKNVELPNRCVKSNAPATRRLKRSLSWHHPAIFLSILISLLVYIILALILRKTAIIYIGLSDEWFARRRRAIVVGWLSALSGIALTVIGIASVDRNEVLGWLILVGIFLFLFGLIWGLVRARMVSPVRISDQYVWLKGVHPEFLADLPQWPHFP
jgi:hypothetical protein